MHKYLHLVIPDLVTWNAMTFWSEARLYYVGEKPQWQGLYALDTQIIASGTDGPVQMR